MSVLAPRLCPLDEQVLAALDGRGKRSDRVADIVCGRPGWRCESCGHEHAPGPHLPRDPLAWEARATRRCFHVLAAASTDRPAVWCEGRSLPRLITTPDQCREIREILRGLEATGYATCRGGWWRRT